MYSVAETETQDPAHGATEQAPKSTSEEQMEVVGFFIGWSTHACRLLNAPVIAAVGFSTCLSFTHFIVDPIFQDHFLFSFYLFM